MTRVRFVAVAFTALVAVAVTGEPAPAQTGSEDRVRVVHVVIDSLHPDEVGPDLPVLSSLQADGTWYEQGRAVMASETLPNHVAMATGTYPGRNGIPGNSGRAEPGDTVVADPDLGIPALREAYSFVEAIEATCPDLRTVTTFSKQYVWRTFSEDPADADFDQPSANIPVSDHAPEAATVPFILDQLRRDDVDYLFANLGDVDRAGHIDATGFSGMPAERRVVLQATDLLLGQIVQTLQDTGQWEDTVFVVSSDHSMDYSNVADAGRHADVQAALDADPRTAGRFFVGQNGGAGFIYLNDPSASDRDQVLADARGVVAAVAGVAEVLYREPNPLDPGHDLASVHPAWHLEGTDRAGELFTYAEPGHIIDSPDGNPLPGNHGHGVTRRMTSLITGGWDGVVTQSVAPSDPAAVNVVDDTEALPEQVEQVDYAPTFGWLLGVDDPGVALDGGGAQWQGRVLEEAFTRQPAAVCGVSSEGAPSTSPPSTGGEPGDEPGDEVADVDDGDDGSLPATGGQLAPWVFALAALGLGFWLRARARPT